MYVWLAACAQDWCGPGTIERDGQCVAAAVCGPGTMEQDGECVVEAPVVDCGPGTVMRGEVCVDLDLQFVGMPFAAGMEVPVMQGNHGNFSHNGFSVYAVDWDVPEGTEIVAARAGRVLEMREDSNEGCAEAACADQANYVVLDHGDGTVGQYWHLQQDGALVEPGDIVARGQPIGLSGNTGWSTDPHLHFQVRDPLSQSLPLYFEDQPETDGAVFPGQSFRSGTVLEDAPEDLPWSDCPTDLLYFLGVTLAPDVPCTRVRRGNLSVGGEVLVEGAQAQVSTWATRVGEWRSQCSAGPAFQQDVDLSPDLYSSYLWLAVAAANDDCYSFQGWDASIYLILAP